jgi:hypothetical protein
MTNQTELEKVVAEAIKAKSDEYYGLKPSYLAESIYLAKAAIEAVRAWEGDILRDKLDCLIAATVVSWNPETTEGDFADGVLYTCDRVKENIDYWRQKHFPELSQETPHGPQG